MDMEEKIQALTAPLTKDDVEFRVGTCNKNGFSLLAYKTARVDTKRLNDVFGTSWTNNYFYDNKGLLCCKIGVYDGRVGGFVYREDVGTESYTEKEKGSYSDAFKRAGFKWGIGVELYNTGLIWIKGNTKEINGKWTAPQLRKHTHLTEDEAIVYYNKKLRRLWKKQGYYKAKKWKLYGYPNYKDRQRVKSTLNQ